MSVESVGPFKEYRLVIDGWEVPLIEAREVDGGEVWLICDKRIACVVPVPQFEEVASFVADVVATCFGYGAHPRDDDFDRTRFQFLPHPTLAPRRVHEITGVQGDDPHEPGYGEGYGLDEDDPGPRSGGGGTVEGQEAEDV